MKSFKFGGFKPSSLFGPKPDAPRPSVPSPSMPRPPAAPTGPRDGFETPGGSRPRGLFGGPSQRPNADVTPEFTSNPMNFAGNNVLNGYNMFPTGKPEGVALPTPQRPFVPANQSVVSLNVNQHQGNSHMTATPAGGPGAQAHYLHYLSTGTGRFAGLEGVPLHPRPNDPSMVVTGPLNGCAVHTMHNTNNNTMSVIHHADYSKNGDAELDEFLAQNPNLRLAGSVKPSDYAHSTGVGRVETGATSFLHYDRPSNGGQGQWTMVTQLNDWKNGGGGAGTRPELGRPQNLPTPWVQTTPLDLP